MAVVREWLLSWQQDIVQLVRPLLPWWPQSIHVFGGVAGGGLECSGLECPCATHMVPLQQAMPLACQAAAHTGAQSSATASRHTHAPSFLPGAIGKWRNGSIC